MTPLQAGRLALWRAVLGFDPERGVRFSTYGGLAIEWALWREVSQARKQKPEGYLPAPGPPALWTRPEVRAGMISAAEELPERLRAVLVAVYGLDGHLCSNSS